MNFDGLTPRETEVLELLAEANTSRAMATELGISVRTVEGHLGVVYRKLRVRNRTEAARVWWEHQNGSGE